MILKSKNGEVIVINFRFKFILKRIILNKCIFIIIKVIIMVKYLLSINCIRFWFSCFEFMYIMNFIYNLGN